MSGARIASRLLAWHRAHGRHDLPWQHDLRPYRVWVSEIMLQQTQVATVIPYFERFMARFPDVPALAAAPADEVLHFWTGLGYYARARNLHRAARIVRDEHGGEFPRTLEAVMALPGIGRSTAGAILAITSGARHAILDGNVKRVLSRHRGVDGPSDEAATLARLWQIAEEQTPRHEVGAYTQAIMDLGATVCVRSRPRCEACPLSGDCVARLEGRQASLPVPKRRRAPRPSRRAVMLVARRDSAVLLVKRPAPGIWGGLWCFPEFPTLDDARIFAHRSFDKCETALSPLPDISHAFTHFDLVITPLEMRCGFHAQVLDGDALWYDLSRPARVGLPAPVKTLLGSLETT